MLNSDKFIDAMHQGKLDLHCIEVSISQKFETGLNLKGYGILKVNKAGTIYLEFICKEASKMPVKSFYTAFPEDPFDSSQKLYLEAMTLDGESIYAEEFSLRVNFFTQQPPYKLHVFLHEIYFLYPTEYLENTENYLYFELLEKAMIPANKMNTVNTSYGEESTFWNEAEIDIGDAKVAIIDKKDRVVVQATGVFDEDDFYKTLLFYLGLSAGIMPQPYCIIRRNGSNTALHLKSTNKAFNNKRIPAPFPAASSGHNWPNYHYNILKEMNAVNRNSPIRFDSSYSQWMRVWHAFNSENSIAILTLGVAIEGLLNDIFIPALELIEPNNEFEDIKAKLITELGRIEADAEHKKALVKHVERWGNIHAGKALSLLVEKGLVPNSEKIAWGDLRNAAAHPKFKENSEARQEKEHKRMSFCLNLFYRLILNVFSFEGAVFEFGKVRDAKLIKRSYVNVLE